MVSNGLTDQGPEKKLGTRSWKVVDHSLQIFYFKDQRNCFRPIGHIVAVVMQKQP